MIRVLDNLADSRPAARFLFKAKPEFGKYWTVPPLMTDLFTDPWVRVERPLDLSKV